MDNQNLQIPDDIRAFLESMVQEAGITSLDAASHQKLIEELYSRLDNFLLTVIVEALPQDKLEEFTKMAEGGVPRNELDGYLKANIPNAVDAFSRAMIEFRDLYLGNVEVARSQNGASP